MSDVEKYIAKRKQGDPEFAEDFESGYSSLKIGVSLAQARIKAYKSRREIKKTSLPKTTPNQ
jgi:hypothetical protein